MSDLQVDNANTNTKPEPAQSASSDANAPNVVDCRYFLTTGCTKGDSCPFRHKEEVKQVNILCSKYLHGGCHDPDCKFVHLPCLVHSMILSYSQPSVSMARSQHKYQPSSQKPTSQKICYYFNHGGCKNGASCPFRHVHTGDVSIEEKFNELINIMKSNGVVAPVSTPSQKREAPPAPRPKRIAIVDGNNSDSLGYSTPAKQESLEVRGARARQNMKQMINGHLAKNSLKARKENHVSINDFVVRTRAEILAAQKEEEEKKMAASRPAVQSVQPVQSVQSENTELTNDVDDDDDDDAAYMDELAKMDQLLGTAKS